MARGTIDLASSYEVLAVFEIGQPDRCYDWSWQQAVRVTSTLAGTAHIGIAPNPGYAGQASGAIGELMNRLSTSQLVVMEDPGPTVLARGLRDTKEWVQRAVVEIREELSRVQADANFQPWLDQCLRGGGWIEHAQRLGGLFDPAFLYEVALVLDISERDAHLLLRKSRDIRSIQRYTRRDRDTDGFVVLREAYLVSALIRGWYHDRVAQLAGRQIWHHPLRSGVLPFGTSIGGPIFVASEAEFIFANIIVAGALEQPARERIGWWVNAVGNARRHWPELAIARNLDDEPFSSREQAERRAFAAAERLEIGVSRRLDRALEWSFKLFPVGLSLVLMPWETIPLELIAIGAGDRVIANAGRAVASHATRRTAHLQELADAGPGRLERPTTS